MGDAALEGLLCANSSLMCTALLLRAAMALEAHICATADVVAQALQVQAADAAQDEPTRPEPPAFHPSSHSSGWSSAIWTAMSWRIWLTWWSAIS